MEMNGTPYQDGLAVVSQTDANRQPDAGNTNTVVYEFARTGTFSAKVGVDDTKTDKGGDIWGAKTYTTSSHMEVGFDLDGKVLVDKVFSARGQSALVSFHVSAGDKLAVDVSNLQAETRGAASEPGQVDIVNPALSS
jgi:hypothetical protein